MRVVIDSMAWLPKSELTEQSLIMLRRGLTLIPKATSEYSSPSPISLFVEKDDVIGVPRYYYFSRTHGENVHVDQTCLGHQLDEKISRIKLRPHQIGVAKKVLDYFNTQYGACIDAETGFGKTIIALYIARELARSTLIIVHKTTLAEQWANRIVGDPNEDDPLLRRGFLPEATVGFIGDGRLQYKGFDFVIATVQSLYEKDFPEDFFRSFGLIIGDELHRMGSEKWSKAIPRFIAKYRLGISATMRRKDKAENAFFFHIGPIVARGSGAVLRPKVYRVETGYSLIETPSFDPSGIGRAQLLTALTDAPSRNNIIVNEVIKAANVGRRVLCASERVEHLTTLIAMTKERMKQLNMFKTCGEFFKGSFSRKKEELEEAKRKDIVFATFKMVEEGEDVADLDTLFITTPLSDPCQLVGRILRVKEGKKQPLVIDIVDSNIDRANSLARSRLRFYNKMEWDVYETKRG